MFLTRLTWGTFWETEENPIFDHWHFAGKARTLECLVFSEQGNQAGSDHHSSVVHMFLSVLSFHNPACMKGHCQMRRLEWRKEILVEHPAADAGSTCFPLEPAHEAAMTCEKFLRSHRQLSQKTACRKLSASYPCKRLQHHLQQTSRATRLVSSTLHAKGVRFAVCQYWHQSPQEHYSVPKTFIPHLIFKFIHFLSTTSKKVESTEIYQLS